MECIGTDFDSRKRVTKGLIEVDARNVEFYVDYYGKDSAEIFLGEFLETEVMNEVFEYIGVFIKPYL